MSVAVRPLQPADIPRLLELIDGLADYEKLPRPEPAARDRLAADAFTAPPRFHALLGDVDGQVVGYAMYFFTYSSFRAQPSLYLEDIFVLPESRGRGAGMALFGAVAAEAVRQGCGRMEWQVLSWNTPSIEFYQRLGARHQDEWQPFRLDGAALERFA
ncbi:MAG TPA: GNAT family N-acetyltransferase [Chloroflexota bacterium]|nr:GNAT family N-acetyltransferase [Chloroflexota bacterium]